MNLTNRVKAAEQLEDPVERLLALELIRQELYAGDTYKSDEARYLLGRSELSSDYWGPLTIAIFRAEKLLRMPPRRSDWARRTSTTDSEPARCLQDARSYIYSDARFWEKSGARWDELAHRASIEANPTLSKQRKAKAEKAAASPVRYSEWHK